MPPAVADAIGTGKSPRRHECQEGDEFNHRGRRDEGSVDGIFTPLQSVQNDTGKALLYMVSFRAERKIRPPTLPALLTLLLTPIVASWQPWRLGSSAVVSLTFIGGGCGTTVA